MHELLSQIKGLLIDVDGVLYNDTEPIPGAPEALRMLSKERIPFRLVTNTSMKSRHSLWQKLKRMGFDVSEEEIFSTVSAAVGYLESQKASSYMPVLTEDAASEFEGIPMDEVSPDFVVVGDLGEAWDFNVLNKAFRALMSGARLVALQKNRYWKRKDGLALDAGPFVTALEYASGQEAVVTGKPNPLFFNAALRDLGLPPSKTAMLGDDIEIDVTGAQKLGIIGVLVCSGKCLPGDAEKGSPDFVLGSLADLL